MDDSLLPHLRRTTEKVVRNASKPGGLLDRGEFTMGKARRMICSKMGLEEGELEGKWKGVVKDLVNRYLDESTQASPEAKTPSPAPKPKSNPTPQRTQPSPSSSKSKSVPQSKSKSKSRSKTRPKVKSKEELTTGSEEDEEVEWEDEKEDMKNQSGGDQSDMSSVYDESPKKRSKHASSKTESGKKKWERKNEKRDPSQEDDSDAQNEDDESSRIHEVNSESEMSSVYDIPPSKSRGKKGDVDRHELKAKKRKSSSTGKDSGNDRVVKRKKEKKDPDEGLEPDEAKVNELKRIVVACGIRRQWSKEFADVPTAKEQIRALHRILSELGMKGNPTISKARAIKERRELAAELDDVREFEATRGLSADKPRASRSRAKQAVVESNSASEDEDDDGQPRQQSALGAVLDFLEDLSD